MKKIYLTLVVSILSILSTCLHAMQVFVKKPDGRIISLDVERDHLVVNLKQKVEKMEGIPEQSQFLFFGGNILEDGSTLAAYGIETNSIIELISPKRILSVAPGDAFNVKAGTVVSFDKLDLVPSTDYSVTSSLDFNFANTIKAKDISLSYIDRIYTFLTPPNPFTGDVKFGYIDYEIKYATKMFLKLLYNGGVSSPWLLDFDSRSDWQSNSVSVTVANKTLREITLGDCSFYEYNSEVTACGAYNWRGKTLIASGKYFDLPRGINCDSIISINLTINQPSDSSQNITACSSYNWRGKTLTASGKYTDSLKTVNGCDSILSLNLTINQPGASSQSIAACSSYNWRGKTLTATGKYTDSLKTVNGCDSIVTLNLTINPVKTGTDIKTACTSFTWIDGKTYTASNTTATHTLVAKNGCDSIVTLNLTINPVKTGIDVKTACASFTWIDGKTYTSSNTTATHKLVAKNGCDSIVTLNLTIYNAPSVVISVKNESLVASQENALYQWLDCDSNQSVILNATNQVFSPLKTGNYAVKVTLNGCADTSSCIRFETKTTGILAENEVVFQIYPNPNQGIFNISGLQIGTYKIINLIGAEVYHFTVDGSDIQRFNLSHLAKGVYHLASEEIKIMNNKIVITD